MRLKIIAYLFLLLLALSPSTVWGATALRPQATIVRHPVGRNAQDQRYDYMLKLLRLILERTRDSHGAYHLEPALPMTQNRIILELERGNIDVAQLPISASANKRLYAIRIPIRKGMLGWRLLLIRRQDQHKFAEIASIEDLKRFRAGFVSQWGDLGILEANVGKVVTHNDYEQLFLMLMAGRFDYLHRGLHEPWDEVSIRKETHPDLHLEETLCLHYPIANYLYVGRGNLALAERLEAGFNRIISDGAFDRLFAKAYGEVIKRANMAARRLIEFQSPFLPADTPLDVKRYWLDFRSAQPP